MSGSSPSPAPSSSPSSPSSSFSSPSPASSFPPPAPDAEAGPGAGPDAGAGPDTGERPPPGVPPQSRRAAGSPEVPAAVAAGAPGGLPPTAEAATDVVRWAAFSCTVVPVVLVVLGTSTLGALGTAMCLAAVTGGCRLLLRRSERARARAVAAEVRRPPVRGRHQRAGTGAHRGRAESDGGAHGA